MKKLKNLREYFDLLLAFVSTSENMNVESVVDDPDINWEYRGAKHKIKTEILELEKHAENVLSLTDDAMTPKMRI